LPWRIHWQVGTDPQLLSSALSMLLRTVFAWQRRLARRAGIATPLCGSVTFIHRFNSQLLLSPHVHALLPEGVWWVDDGGALSFKQLPPPTDDEVEALLRRIGARIEALVQQHTDDAIDDNDPDALQTSLAEAAAAPRRNPWHTHSAASVPPVRPRCFALDGYSLHANVAVAADDRRGLRRLLRYGARSALAARRVSLSPQGMVIYKRRERLERPATTCVSARARSPTATYGGATSPSRRASLKARSSTSSAGAAITAACAGSSNALRQSSSFAVSKPTATGKPSSASYMLAYTLRRSLISLLRVSNIDS